MEKVRGTNMVKKSISRTQRSEIEQHKVLSQEELLSWWPFDRVDGKSLERLHKKVNRKQELDEYEESPI